MFESLAKGFKDFGPVPALFAVLCIAIWWLSKRLNDSEERERKVREELVENHKDSTKMLSDASTVVKDALHSHDRNLERQTNSMDRLVEEIRRNASI